MKQEILRFWSRRIDLWQFYFTNGAFTLSEFRRSVRPLQGYLAHKKSPPPQDHHRALDILLLQGPRGALFLMSEVPLWTLQGLLEVKDTRRPLGDYLLLGLALLYAPQVVRVLTFE